MSVKFLGVLASLMLVLVLPATRGHAAESATISEEELVRRAQQLMDAVAIGDKTPWKAYLADDVIFVDEIGKEMDKHAALASLQHLPDGSMTTKARTQWRRATPSESGGRAMN
jgi:hypothetical protein